jgi:RNA polymerase sigma factor (sigma-70 family)
MVLGICRRIVGDAHAADDAFQATFFILARKARTIRKSESVASWLHGVARRVGARARESGRTRRWYERRWRHRPPADGLQDVAWRDVGAILDEEIQRLPERIRAPFVLCYLEGATNDMAARNLGCPTGTVLSRLSKARELLRARLTRRGLALSAGFLAATPSEGAVRVPAALAEAVCRVGAGAGHPWTLTPEVAALAADALRPGWTTAGVASMSGAALTVAFVAICLGRGGNAIPLEPEPPAAVADIPTSDLDRIQGSWAVTASVYQGQTEPPETMRGARATICGNTMNLFGTPAPAQKMTIVLDPTTKIKAFDMTPADGPARGMTSRGIYRLDGDTLLLCVPAGVSRLVVHLGPRNAGESPHEKVLNTPAARPDDFTAPRGSYRRMFTLQRIAPEP